MSKKLYKEKLLSSGLTITDAKTLNIELLLAPQTAKLHGSFKSLPAIKLNYHDPTNQKRSLKAKPQWPDFYRLRYLAQPKDFTMLTEKDSPRYVQPPDSGVCAYFPRIIDWSSIINDPDQPIIITEGELKAAKACKEGFPTIGLGGVYSFRSAKLGVVFLPELELVNWVQRNVYIVYDSDSKTNPQICKALNALAKELEARGALPQMVSLPDVVDDGKTGLDDFLVAHTSQEFVDVLQSAQPLTLAKPLLDLNNKVIYIHNPGLILDCNADQKMSPAAFKEHAYSALSYAEQTVKPDGTISMKPASAAATWLKWPFRKEAGELTYAPGAEKYIEGSTVRQSKYNVWPGWSCEPKKGDVSLFLRLVDHIFTNASPGAKEWFLQWCAYPLQYPGIKLFTSAVIYGTRHGTGKSLLGYTMGDIYGKNFTEIKQADLHGNFNEWAEAKQFILGDEVTSSNKRQDSDMLKNLITQKELRVNAKYIPSYVVPDCINYLFTSNHPDAFFLEDDDRRYFIHEVTVEPLDEAFYVEYDMWRSSGGAAAVFQYLLDLDLSTFNPAAAALKTEAKKRMISDVKSDLGGWVAQLMSEPERILRLGDLEVKADLFNNAQLLQFYDPAGRTGTTANGLGREMRRAGVPQVCNGNPVVTDLGQHRFYAVRNADRWTTETPASVKKHINDTQMKGPKF